MKQNRKQSDNEIKFHGSFENNIWNTFEKRLKFQLQIIVIIKIKSLKNIIEEKCFFEYILAKHLVLKTSSKKVIIEKKKLF